MEHVDGGAVPRRHPHRELERARGVFREINRTQDALDLDHDVPQVSRATAVPPSAAGLLAILAKRVSRPRNFPLYRAFPRARFAPALQSACVFGRVSLA